MTAKEKLDAGPGLRGAALGEAGRAARLGSLGLLERGLGIKALFLRASTSENFEGRPGGAARPSEPFASPR
jgi:hypothetical protein